MAHQRAYFIATADIPERQNLPANRHLLNCKNLVSKLKASGPRKEGSLQLKPIVGIVVKTVAMAIRYRAVVFPELSSPRIKHLYDGVS